MTPAPRSKTLTETLLAAPHCLGAACLGRAEGMTRAHLTRRGSLPPPQAVCPAPAASFVFKHRSGRRTGVLPAAGPFLGGGRRAPLPAAGMSIRPRAHLLPRVDNGRPGGAVRGRCVPHLPVGFPAAVRPRAVAGAFRGKGLALSQADRARYRDAVARMQTAVAYHPDKSDQEPKHLRVGVNVALRDIGSLIELLIAKGVISQDEVDAAIADGMAFEVAEYQKRIAEAYGVPEGSVTLAPAGSI